MIENCKNCVFGVVKFGHQTSYRQCQRNPPVVMSGVVGHRMSSSGSYGGPSHAEEVYGTITAWPKVEDTDFCGEFELCG